MQFDSSEEEDEYLASYIETHKHKLGQTQPITNVVNTKDDLFIAKGEIAVLKEKYEKTEKLIVTNTTNYLKEKEQLVKKYEDELNQLKSEISALNHEKTFLNHKLKVSNRKIDSEIDGNSMINDSDNNAITNSSPGLISKAKDLSNSSILEKRKKRDENIQNNSINDEIIPKRTILKTSILNKIPDDDECVIKDEPVNIKQKIELSNLSINNNTTKNVSQDDKKKRPFLNFKTTVKFNDNYTLLNLLVDYRLPSFEKTVIELLDITIDGAQVGTVFINLAREHVMKKSLSEYIITLIEHLEGLVKEFANKKMINSHNKSIPLVISLSYQIMNFRPSVFTNVDLHSRIIKTYELIKEYEFVLKSKSILDAKLQKIIPKTDVTYFDFSDSTVKTKKFNLGIQSIDKNNDNLFLKNHTSLLSTSYNDFQHYKQRQNNQQSNEGDLSVDDGIGYIAKRNKWIDQQLLQKADPELLKYRNINEIADPVDYLYEMPCDHIEMVDYLIISFSFDLFESLVSNLDFIFGKKELFDNEDVDIVNEIHACVKNLFDISFTTSYQPLISCILSNCRIFNDFFSINFKLNYKNYISNFVDLINVQSEWLLKINLKNYLHKLPKKQNMCSLKRFIGGSSISQSNTLQNYYTLLLDESCHLKTIEQDEYIIIHDVCEYISSTILDNIFDFVDNWFNCFLYNKVDKKMIDNVEQNGILASLLKNVTTILTTNFIACQGEKTKPDLPLKKRNTIKCIKILQMFNNRLSTLKLLLEKQSSKKVSEIEEDEITNNSVDTSNINSFNLAKLGTSDFESIEKVTDKLEHLIINDENWKKDLIVYISRIIYQDQKNVLIKHELLKDFLTDLLDSLVTFEDSESIYDALIL
ncbi:uncharacterized protein HGUI_01763 [Hanseniaspora guilliermondii]|uniref:Uncharacterized protein n=1 Tax=Hanseniaspora guilliermondii TaxID=56406 RepID=A0A1L0B3M7_9ASCO|nr:uncharacterized protein HGUI_01763 [Hanseniaspora guilliermondii]